ncbi:PorT family protein [Tamlana sp. s12]|uniref:porin family protein n=1 Tax=Tamlana sp. s12 TaxID=1630406 RepID=UPI0007FC455F|nr:porin family protein [Tamlana sp. s12]OBQ54602.1 hypothetical protein VQ01_10630 [Tamlana sp. s12]QQY82092.1 PorT family protein [Tamlana sp. s12]
MNKHLFLVTCLLLVFSYNAKAQNTEITIGFKAGANYSSYTPRYIFPNIKDIHYARKVGFYIGGLVNFEISNDFRVQPELIFALQGAKLVNKNLEFVESEYSPPTYGDFELNINESTIILPIVAQYLINDKFYLEGGPQFGYIVNRKERITKNPIPDDSETPTESADFDYDKFDFGLTFGFGYNFSEKISVNTRYFFGLIERNYNIKSSVISLGLEYKI